MFTAVSPPPEGPRGTRLNNFVTRLHDGPLAEDDVRFFVPEDGWVWMSITGAAEAEATPTPASDQMPAPTELPAEMISAEILTR